MTKAPLRSPLQITKIIRDWLGATATRASSDSSEETLVNQVRLLADLLGEGRRQLLEGIGPDRSKRVILQKKDIVFYLTSDSSPDKFYRKKLVTEEVGGATVIVTNGHDYYVVKHSTPVHGGNFDWVGLSDSEKAATVDMFTSVLCGEGAYTGGKAPKSSEVVSSSIAQRLRKIVNTVETKCNEEQVKKDFVFPLCRIAGWHVDPDDGNDSKTEIEVERFQPHKGRLDLLLKDESVPRIVIECKKPGVTIVRNGMITEDGRKAMEQAHRYATGVRFWRQKRLPNIMSLVTNGKQAIWFDSTARSFEDAMKSAQSTEITNDTISVVYQAINLQRVRETDLSYICNTKTIYDEKKVIETSATHMLAREVTVWLSEIRKAAKRLDKEDALAMTLQVLFLTVARDHGILGSEEIESDIEKSNWDSIFRRCNKRFNSNVFETERPEELKPEVLDTLYERSQRLPFSLEAIPVEYVGDIYESLLHHLHSDEKHLSKTSYFTPQWLVKEIVADIKPTKDEKVIDPTCGSAAFLCFTFDYVTRDMDFEEAREYLSTKIFGVDRDPLAVQVSRFALLVDLARKVNGDWKEKEHILPKLTDHIVATNFFTFETKDRYDVALGNPPWGSIDKEVRDNGIKKSLEDFKSYDDKTDICIYIVEKAFDLLSKKGRLGFLVQRSAIDGTQHKVFRDWWNGRIETVWDFGSDELFAPRNAALTAVLFGRSVAAKKPTQIVNRSTTGNSLGDFSGVEGVPFSTKFHCFKGGEPAKLEVYELFAAQNPKHPLVRPLACPEVIDNGVVKGDRRALFLSPQMLDSEVPKDVVKWLKETDLTSTPRDSEKPITRSCYWWLKNDRAECPRLTWKRLNGYKNYKFDSKQSRIVFPYYLNGERLTAGLDTKGVAAPLTSTTVLIPKENTSKEDVYFTLAWLNSKSFAQTEGKKGKLAAKGGRALYKDYVEQMLIPSVSKEAHQNIFKIVDSSLPRGFSESDLTKIDKLFEGAINMRKRKAA